MKESILSNKPRWTVRLVAQIPDSKSKEFIESLRTLPVVDTGTPETARLFRALDAEGVYCWLADWTSRAKLSAFLESEAFRALRGGTRVLGTLVELSIEETRESKLFDS
jgi:hypothetical protein